MKKLVIGTGPDWPNQKKDWHESKMVEAIGLDIIENFQPDIVRDILRGLPFSNATFDEVEVSHVLEHISGHLACKPTDNFDFVMSEIHRVLVFGGRAKIEVPYWKDDHAIEASGHVRLFNENSFVNYYANPYGYLMGQVQFSGVESCEIQETARAANKPSRVVRITLIK